MRSVIDVKGFIKIADKGKEPKTQQNSHISVWPLLAMASKTIFHFFGQMIIFLAQAVRKILFLKLKKSFEKQY